MRKKKNKEVLDEKKGEKDIKDEIKLDNIKQIHSAVLQFSSNTMEIKKLFISVLIAYFTIMAGMITKISISTNLAIKILATIVVLFWILDAQSYYYQKKLRRLITKLQNELIEKADVTENTGSSMKTLQRLKVFAGHILKSMFNMSMFIYYLIIAALIIVG
ncbi:hypothetical protein [Lacrimispora xylanolytica]|uniref:Uncharacterized protein n=1 Tax=Lacrimispora xylanolytica TaxID=29375 RepID=A0ABY7ACP1_9FIRM|nr:hypothetical protein [Lacrimispora xylanolytica]WAJ24038.1 hypothetical protein OW255_00470 [Lacrimispora xylanolytica]